MNNKKTCETCRHFVRHYVEDASAPKGSRFIPIGQGHCTTRRGKRVQTEFSCDQYEKGDFVEEFRKALEDFDS